MDTKVVAAAKWSLITEILAKLITPVTNIILAHILAPTAFGILATIMMVISFAEMLADAGFQKFLVQYEFESEDEKQKNVSVAFISNIVLAIVLWLIIIIWRDELAILVGNEGLGFPLAVMGAMLPLGAFSSIQMAMYRRSFNFKFLLSIRMITIITPLFISIPMALAGFDYWSLIAGLLAAHLFTAIALCVRQEKLISIYFSSTVFRKMFSFSAWSLAEAFSIWLTAWVDTFIISHFLDAYYLGLYKMPTAIVTTVMAIATSSMAPVLFSALSRHQHNQVEFEKTFLTFQRYMALFLVPLGVGMFVYQDFIVEILLGPQWKLAGIVLGSWALSSSLVTAISYLISEAFRAKGMPNISFLAQMAHLFVLIPVIYVCVQYDFTTFVYARSIVRVQMIAVLLYLLAIYVGMNAWLVIRNIKSYIIASAVVGTGSYVLLHLHNSMIWTIFCICISLILYLVVLYLFPTERIILTKIWESVLLRLKRS
ncbi:lipopolysaccharide biosynthesis protein [Veillonella tobetsuensis]|jgi:polysaccharide biosynthesis protein|uniref:Lipopolysaccharide biosynthesis protein n=1 Tax=Veillonella tobetsuensis TaxID=1110546 RepID=A0A2S7ZMW1_9FIRM|nr:lipopolysaccharide biosynthesis protein [Veillonella tobetsuensis]PQL24596.1 lipopolysaccharide biosynthesis protein [Veillonella tobetsuensis]